jgi:hypothetical protein
MRLPPRSPVREVVIVALLMLTGHAAAAQEHSIGTSQALRGRDAVKRLAEAPDDPEPLRVLMGMSRVERVRDLQSRARGQ